MKRQRRGKLAGVSLLAQTLHTVTRNTFPPSCVHCTTSWMNFSRWWGKNTFLHTSLYGSILNSAHQLADFQLLRAEQNFVRCWPNHVKCAYNAIPCDSILNELPTSSTFPSSVALPEGAQHFPPPSLPKCHLSPSWRVMSTDFSRNRKPPQSQIWSLHPPWSTVLFSGLQCSPTSLDYMFQPASDLHHHLCPIKTKHNGTYWLQCCCHDICSYDYLWAPCSVTPQIRPRLTPGPPAVRLQTW